MPSSLIIGADSTIGGAYYHKLRAAGQTVTGTSRRGTEGLLPLDLAADPASWPILPESDTAFLCAAITKLDACERDPETTRRINVEQMQHVAERLLAMGMFVVFLSTNQVFDGERPYRKANEPTCPRNAYGRQKAEFEQWLLSRTQPAAVLRLTKVVPARLPLFAQWEAALTKGEAITAFDDLRFSPVPLRAVLESMAHVAAQRMKGVYHISGTDDISYFQAATLLAERMGADTRLVTRGSALSSGMNPAFLPPYGTLDRATLAHIAVPEPFDVIIHTDG